MKIKNEFIELHRPRHVHFEAFREAVQNKTHVALAEEEVSRKEPSNLLDVYLRGDMRQIIQDFWMRPDHYSPRQQDILIALSQYQDPDPAITDAEKTDLLLTWMRDTATQQRFRELNKKTTDPDEEIVLEDGRTLDESVKAEKEPDFETQDFGDKIII